MTVGSHAIAKELITIVGNRWRLDNIESVNPDWRYIGGGSTRSVYLHIPTNVVYKVGDDWCNRQESKRMRQLRARKRNAENVHFPAANVYKVGKNVWITAMEFIDGKETQCTWSRCDCKTTDTDPCYREVWDLIEKIYGLTDMFCANVLVDKNRHFWVIDAAE